MRLDANWFVCEETRLRMSFSPLIELLEQRVAPAALVNPTTVTFTDADGDLATLKISKPLFTSANVNTVLKFDTGTVDQSNATHQQLQTIDLTQLAGDNGISLTLSAQQAGGGDGKVDVGQIKAISISGTTLGTGIDLGAVKISGDLGRIDVGDASSVLAIKSLSVGSMGVKGTTTGASDLHSHIRGTAGAISVAGDVQNALLDISDTSAKPGSGGIGSLNIAGSLIGGSTANSGEIHFTGVIAKALVGGLSGNSAAETGSIIGDYGTLSKISSIFVTNNGIAGGGGNDSGQIAASTISSVTVTGDVTGAGGKGSGVIQAASLGHVTINGSLTGGSVLSSGEIFADTIGSVTITGNLQGGTAATHTGTIEALSSIGNVKIGQSLLGGAGDQSGAIVVSNGNIGSVSVGLDFKGGSGNNSGDIFSSGTIGKISIGNDFVGGDSTLIAKLTNSGYVQAQRILSVTIGNDFIAGTDNGGGIDTCGAIRADNDIGALTVKGNITGNSSNPAIISALGQHALAASAKSDIAIRSVTVGGKAEFADILAGYSTDTSSNLLGQPLNADASIGAVKIGTTISSSNIVAGVVAGADGKFGTSDDARISGSGTTDRLDLVSKISSVIINGAVVPAASGNYGIVAQWVASVKANGAVVPLQPGPSNDTSPVPIDNSSDFHALEVV